MHKGTSVESEVITAGASACRASTARDVASSKPMRVGLLTGGQDRPYAFGLAMALIEKGIPLDVIGSDEIDSPEMHSTANLTFLNLKGSWRERGRSVKVLKLAVYYMRLMWYVAFTDAKVLHILWNNRFEYFDRTLLMAYFRLLDKKVLLTAHNVNIGRRDGTDSWLNRVTLRIQYYLANHIFVHTPKMRDELCREFDVHGRSVTVLRHPINNAFPDTDLQPEEAKEQLGLAKDDKAILFFGRIRPYKGLEYLLQAFEEIAERDPAYRLIIAGEWKKGLEAYFSQIQDMIRRSPYRARIVEKSEFIPDQDAEVYLKAADVMVLPYKEIFQSGVLFLSYSFGLPVVVTDVGSFREEVIEGKTGFVCPPCDKAGLAKAIERYFGSELFCNLAVHRRDLREYAFEHHSWGAVAELTRNAYSGLLKG